MQINVFAFPFAGGNQYAFTSYKDYLDSNINFKPIEPPGRGLRIREPLLNNLNDIVDDIYNKIFEDLSIPYIFYGHSMGGSIATLLIHKLIKNNKPLPLHLFVTGHGSPRYKDPNKKEKIFTEMTDDEFKKELKLLGGCPEEILENEELFNFFLPMLKADFSAIENFKATYDKAHSVPITVIIGDNEENITDKELEAWKEESEKTVSLSKLEGDHFFIYKHTEYIANKINEICSKSVPAVY